jgi:hypothetical protein
MKKEQNFPYTHEEFLKLMSYDKDTGILSWRNPRDSRIRNHTPKGYIKFKIKNVHYRAHRLIWFYHYGRWPSSDVIDHIDRNKHNNRIENLREATFSENCKNKNRNELIKQHEQSGGEIFKNGSKFLVEIKRSFQNLEEAELWLNSLFVNKNL